MTRPNMPNLFIIGAARAGTTTLYSVLRRHPDVFMTLPKATRFFTKTTKYEQGLDWYLDTFFSTAGDYPVRGEATPSYLAQAEIVAPRIQATIPGDQTRFIVVFRNPVERAYSHYWYNRNKKASEGLSFEAALALEEEAASGTGGVHSRRSHTTDYVRNGLYARCLQEYYRYFKPSQLQCLLFEDLAPERFESMAAGLMKFLEIEVIPAQYTRENPARKVGVRPIVKFKRQRRSLVRWMKFVLPAFIQNRLRERYSAIVSSPVGYPPMKSQTRAMLLEKYRSDVLELQDLIGRDLSHWLREV